MEVFTAPAYRVDDGDRTYIDVNPDAFMPEFWATFARKPDGTPIALTGLLDRYADAEAATLAVDNYKQLIEGDNNEG